MLAYLDTLIGFAVVMLGCSLLITIATQMVSALFSHRGANLRWGLNQMFSHLNIPNPANVNLAHEVLTHPLISDSIFSKFQFLSRFRLATAIKPEEVVAILKDLAANRFAGTPTATAITAALNAPSDFVDRRILQLTGAANLPAALAVAGVGPVLEQTVATIRDRAGKFEGWFNATMDRVSARFTTYIRLWTVAFSIAFALFTGLNTVNLLDELFKNGAFRNLITGQASQVMNLANTVLPEGSKDAATKLFTGLVAKALQDSGAKADATPANIASESEANAWITAHVADKGQQEAALKSFGAAFLDQRTADIATLRTIAGNASFDIAKFGWKKGQPFEPQIPGALATAALLSLGAPFWFNSLKQLTNLRPILANKTDTPPSK